jgi:hypothetical protein
MNVFLVNAVVPAPQACDAGRRSPTAFGWLQVCTVSSFSALIFCLLFHQGKSKGEKVLLG